MSFEFQVDTSDLTPQTLGSTDDAEVSVDPVEPGENVILHPLTGEVIDTSDVDSLILACDEIKQQMSDLRTVDRALREAAWALTEGDLKTRRLRGRQYQAKVVQGDAYPDQGILKEAFAAYPQFRDEFLRIGSISLRKRECKKLDGMQTDDPAFQTFRKMVMAAIADASEGLPTVTMEK